jgi:hypothetical protein
MGTTVLPKVRARREAPPNRVWDRVFFSCMIVFAFVVAVTGFWPTYFGAGMVRAPLPSTLVHVHGAVYTLWMVLLVVQSALISAKRVRVHKTLGIGGFGLAVVMIVLGFATAVQQLRHNATSFGFDGRFFLVIPLSDVFVFTVLIALAFRARYRPVAHKRYILYATVILLDAALGRGAFRNSMRLLLGTAAVLLLAPMVYDLVALRRVPRATWVAVVLLVVVEVVRFPLGHSAAWTRFAEWLRG